MTKPLRTLSIATVLSLSAGPTLAMQNIGNHAGMLPENGKQFEVALVQSDIDVKGSGSTNGFDFDSLAIAYSTRLQDGIDLIAQGAIVYDIEVNTCDGEGLFFGGGARAPLTKIQNFDIFGYALLNYTTFDIDCGSGSADGNMLSLHIAPVARYVINEDVAAYASLELIPLSDGSIDDSDVEHADFVNLSVGASGRFQQFDWHARLNMVGETGVLLSLGKSF